MRELDFLPDWYRKLHRRKRFVMLQMWLSIAIICALGLRIFLAGRNVRADEESLATLQAQLDQTNGQLQKLHESQVLRQQLSQQAEIVAKLGPHVPTARLLNALDEVMPRQMGLLDLSVDTQMSQKAATGIAAASGNVPTIDRRVSIRLHGVAPSGEDVGDFLARLASVPYFENINPSYSRDRNEGGHTMREFEVTFSIALDDSRQAN
jgi:Tfp pilus assembly protein PilN